MNKGIFNTGKPNKRIANAINIKSPTAFKESITKLRKGGVTGKEKKALVLAQNRAKAQLKRKHLSSNERKQFRQIVKIKLPKVSK